MREILELYYRIKLDYYKEIDNSILFCVDGVYYLFCETEFDEEYLIMLNKLVIELKISKLYLHDFIFNINGNIKSENYVLLKINVLEYDVDIDDVNNFMVYVKEEFYSNYILLEDRLAEKVDYLENNSLDGITDYYIGIYEVLISNLKKYSFDSKLVLSHRVFNLNSYYFYNPLNVCIDIYWRDIASYIRLSGDSGMLLDFLYNFKGDVYEYNYFFSRMVLPYEYTKDVRYEEYLLKMEKLFGIDYFVWLKKSN